MAGASLVFQHSSNGERDGATEQRDWGDEPQRCPSCWARVGDADHFCPSCGAAVAVGEPVRLPPRRRLSGAAWTPSTGFEPDTVPMAPFMLSGPPTASPRAPSRSRAASLLIWAVLGALTVTIGTGIGFLLYSFVF